jgi:hypothetical protein
MVAAANLKAVAWYSSEHPSILMVFHTAWASGESSAIAISLQLGGDGVCGGFAHASAPMMVRACHGYSIHRVWRKKRPVFFR